MNATTNVGGKNTAKSNVLFNNGDNKVKPASTPATVTVVIPTKEKEPIPPVQEALPVQAQTTVQETVILPIQKSIPTIREMQERAEKMHLLSQKYDKLCSKKQDIDVFSISHDGDTARMVLTDAKGQRFESSNPVCIRQLIDIWKKTYSDAMGKTEEEMRLLIQA